MTFGYQTWQISNLTFGYQTWRISNVVGIGIKRVGIKREVSNVGISNVRVSTIVQPFFVPDPSLLGSAQLGLARAIDGSAHTIF